MSYIKNKNILATSEKREQILSIIEAGYTAIDTSHVIKDSISLRDSVLEVRGKKFDLSLYNNIYILGCGKVACSAAYSLEKMLQGHVKSGAVVGITEGVCEVIETFQGTHPLPSEVNFKASTRMKDIAMGVEEDDLVLVVVGGGGSALLCGSSDEHAQGDRLYKKFLQSGGSIHELNIVRKHLSDLKGGGLARILFPATVVGLIFSDVPGGGYSNVASGPTYLDTTTVDDAMDIITKYSLGDFDLVETPKGPHFFEKVHNIVLVSNMTALDAMSQRAKEYGYETEIVCDDFFGTPEILAQKMQDASLSGKVVLAGGEVSLSVPEGCEGKGGRNDYMALEMMGLLNEGQVFASFASDGHDNSDSAGALVDTLVIKNLTSRGIESGSHKVCLDSYTLFDEAGTLIYTGDIEANVSDLMVLLY